MNIDDLTMEQLLELNQIICQRVHDLRAKKQWKYFVN